MAETNFEKQHQFLEEDIELLSRTLRAGGEGRVKEQEQAREAVRESLQGLGAEPPLSHAQSSRDENSLLPGYVNAAPEDIKLRVEELVDMAIHKGIEIALKQARKESPFVLDALHDALVEKIYPELQKRGVVK